MRDRPLAIAFGVDTSVSVVEPQTLGLDEQQAPEREVDALSLSRAKQQSCGSGGSPLLNRLRRGVPSGRPRLMCEVQRFLAVFC